MKKKILELTLPSVQDVQFRKDVYEGLISSPKKLNSKYFYDKKGDELFQMIMKLPEYYLTNSELEILNNNKEKMLERIDPSKPFQLVDLGAGDALKTKILLKHFTTQEIDFTYIPVDISSNAIKKLTAEIKEEIPAVKIDGVSQEYLSALENLSIDQKKVILFLGASIGNFSKEETVIFLKNISKTMKKEDLFIIGFDLKKDPAVILAAYNDKAGVTKKFNLNLLERINREMGANFDIDQFEHLPVYSIESGEARSALISMTRQKIDISNIELSIELQAGEPIHTEISRKYSINEIKDLAEAAGFEVVENWMDSKNYFTDSLWRKVK